MGGVGCPGKEFPGGGADGDGLPGGGVALGLPDRPGEDPGMASKEGGFPAGSQMEALFRGHENDYRCSFRACSSSRASMARVPTYPTTIPAA